MGSWNCTEGIGPMEEMKDLMQRLLPVVVRELTDLALECVNWALVGVVFLVSVWFLTDGLPRLVAIFNGLVPARVNHLATVHSIPSVVRTILIQEESHDPRRLCQSSD